MSNKTKVTKTKTAIKKEPCSLSEPVSYLKHDHQHDPQLELECHQCGFKFVKLGAGIAPVS